MSDEETTIDELLRDMLWSRARARRILRRMSLSTFEDRAAVAAIVDDHDRRCPDAPREGVGRVLSVVRHAMRLRQEITDHPERFTPAAGLEAHRTGAPDPALLIHAKAVLEWLPTIIAGSSEPFDVDDAAGDAILERQGDNNPASSRDARDNG